VVRHVMEVAGSIHRLTNGVANFYLIDESGKLVLGMQGRRKTGRYSPRQPWVWGRPWVIWTQCC
jgi:hypothetical protein